MQQSTLQTQFLNCVMKCFLSFLGILLPSFCWASLAPRIDTTYFEQSHQAYMETFYTEKDVEKIIPLDLTPEMTDDKIAAKIADRSFSNFMKTPAVQNSYLGRTAKSVEKATQTNVTIQESPNSIAHKFKFQMLAFQNEALIKYSGYMNASLKYEIAHSLVNFEVTEPISKAQEVVFNYQSSSTNTLNQILIRMTF
ncbi:MAG: hypothetical protein AB7O96_19305 [Pseudobdellovibrionaceae bacterium]